jgi:hypothetical protein
MALLAAVLLPRSFAQDATVVHPLAPEFFRLELDATEPMPSWIILVQSDGTGLYWHSTTAKFGEEPIHLSEATWKRVQAGASAVEANRCETRLKNIAKTGVKDVEYGPGTTPETHFDCTFNYSDDAGLNDAIAALEAMAATMRTGDQMAHQRRFDRLGLDATLDSLLDEFKAGRAIEVENIAPVLQGIVGDDRLMQRVRSKAAHLLESAAAVGPAR